MTTIAWDGVTLASDRKATMGGTPVPFRKIWRIEGERTLLCGASGDAYLATAWRRWMERQGEPPPIPTDPGDMYVMVIDEHRRIWTADLRRIYTRVRYPYWAIGSGADYALGAMAAGETAAKALRIASRLDTGTGLGVETLTFRRSRR